jgi:hypothetical protein
MAAGQQANPYITALGYEKMNINFTDSRFIDKL